MEVDIQQPYALASPLLLCLSARSQATAQVVPPEGLKFRKWLTIWSGESAELQDANEKERCAAILEDGLNGAYARKPKPPKSKTQEQKNTAKEGDRLRERGEWRALAQPGPEQKLMRRFLDSKKGRWAAPLPPPKRGLCHWWDFK